MITKDNINDYRIMECLSGSHAYGTNIASSDIDYRGLFVSPPELTLSPFDNVSQHSGSGDEDRVLYDLDKFMQMVVNQNPNIIELLWCDESDIIFRSDAYDYLRSQRDVLLSSKAKFTFSGYAMSQLKRIKGHNKWINNPRDILPPKQTDFVSIAQNFTKFNLMNRDFIKFRYGHRLIPYGGNLHGVYKANNYDLFDDDHDFLNTVYDKDLDHDFFNGGVFHRLVHGGRKPPLFIISFRAVEYKLDHDNWKSYWTWKNNRNEVRATLEEDHGYDTKHAMHLIRLMSMCVELLESGKVNVKRDDADYLLSIRFGSLSYSELLLLAESFEQRANELYKTTKLQKTVDQKVAAKIHRTTQAIAWSQQ